MIETYHLHMNPLTQPFKLSNPPLQVVSTGIPMHSRMIHDHDGTRTPMPYGKKGQVRCGWMD